MNADKFTLKQRTSTSIDGNRSINFDYMLEVNEANMYKLIDSVYNLFINNQKK